MSNRRHILIIILNVVFFLACQRAGEVTYIRIRGSDTMKVLVSLWAEEFMKQNINISIYSEGGGSAQGIQALIRGEIDICATSRPMMAHEIRQLAERHNRLGISFLVAKDALSIYVNPQNPVHNLTIDQLQGIYSGRISNWQQVGGADAEIAVINRSPNSGTFFYFKDHILKDESYRARGDIFYSTDDVVRAVQNNQFAIGYGGTAYGETVVHCRINGIEPSVKNVINDTYPIIRYLYLYTIDTPRGVVADFIDWILTESGQSIVARSGYIPLWNQPLY